MCEVLTIGSAIVDIFLTSQDLIFHRESKETLICEKLGEKLTLDKLEIYSGGGASNVAVGLRRLGFKAGVVSELGKDLFAEVVIKDLIKSQIETKFLIKEKLEQTGSGVILVGPDGGRTALVYRGAASMLDPDDLPIDPLAQSRWIHLTNLGGRMNTIKRLFEIVKYYRLKLSWNPGKNELELLAADPQLLSDLPIQILFLNLEEWQSLKARQNDFLAQISTIVVTDGSRGGEVYLDGQSASHFDSQKTDSVDDTGAGDAFAAGFIGATLGGLEPQVACEWGVKNAVSVIKQMGAKAGLLTIREIS